MPLPSYNDIIVMGWSKNGEPWVNLAAKNDIELDGMGWSKNGEPWWGLELAVSGAIKKVGGILQANIKNICGIPNASVKKVCGVSNI